MTVCDPTRARRRRSRPGCWHRSPRPSSARKPCSADPGQRRAPGRRFAAELERGVRTADRACTRPARCRSPTTPTTRAVLRRLAEFQRTLGLEVDELTAGRSRRASRCWLSESRADCGCRGPLGRQPQGRRRAAGRGSSGRRALVRQRVARSGSSGTAPPASTSPAAARSRRAPCWSRPGRGPRSWTAYPGRAAAADPAGERRDRSGCGYRAAVPAGAEPHGAGDRPRVRGVPGAAAGRRVGGGRDELPSSGTTPGCSPAACSACCATPGRCCR